MPRGRCTGNSPPVCIVPYLSSFSDDDGDGQPPSLSTLFAPPKGLMFRGSLDAAKAEACRKEVWLVRRVEMRLKSCLGSRLLSPRRAARPSRHP